MEGLFFVINQIWFLRPINIGYCVMSLVLGVLLYLIYSKKRISIETRNLMEDIQYNPIPVDDLLYIEKTLLEMRSYISKKYLPEHTWAHTSKDIIAYIQDTSLIELMEDLERKEYTGIMISREDATLINTQLIKIFQ